MGAHWETSQKGLAREHVCRELPQLNSQGASTCLGCVAGSALLARPERSSRVCSALWLFGVTQRYGSGDPGDPVLGGCQGGRKEAQIRKADLVSPC